MTARPRTREHFPRMKFRGGRRRYRRAAEDTMRMFISLGINPNELLEALRGAAEALRQAQREMTFGFTFPVFAPAPPLMVDRSGYVLDDAFDPEPESCSLCDDHVHDITNTACVCCMVNAPDLASTRRAPADLLTLQCMAAAHDRCEGDFCECACHDTNTEGN